MERHAHDEFITARVDLEMQLHVEASFIKGHTVDVANDEALLERLREGSEAMIVSSARVLNNQTGRLCPSAFTSSSE